MNKLFTSKENGARKISAILIVCAMMTVGISLTVDNTVSAEFVNYMAVPWTQDFTPSDSAWDSTGNHCVVIGNDTSDLQSSAWYYNEPAGTWSQITEGTDAAETPANYIEIVDTGTPYATIQNAIDAANSGETIRVWAGSYNENIAVNVPITIIGNGSANTIIDGGNAGDVVSITASGVNFNNFGVTGSGAGNAGILLINADNCQINDNAVFGNGDGIRLEGSSNNIITENNIENNDLGMITTDSAEIKTLVGITEGGGPSGQGTLFEMDLDGSNADLIHDFKPGYTDVRYPYYDKLCQDVIDPNIMYSQSYSGGIYGQGAIYQTDRNGATHNIIYDFKGGTSDGSDPYGSLIAIGTKLYGMNRYGGANNDGTIFSIETDGSQYTILHDFMNGAADGANPEGGLMYDGMALYGMTYGGGTSGLGVIFTINTDGTGFNVLHSFSGGAVNGQYPRGDLTLDIMTGTKMYGMTYNGGTSNMGVLFEINTDGTGFLVLHSFTGGLTNGQNPFGLLIQDGWSLYGMTYSGGSANVGTIFKYDTSGPGYFLLHSFAGGAGGANPYASLETSGGVLYGFTYNGGVSGLGSVFRINNDGTLFNVIYSFTATPNGYRPRGTPMIDGFTLYGTCGYGGLGVGTTFRIDLDGSAYSVLHSFENTMTDGQYPYGHVTQDGTSLYGMTNSGGALYEGTIYKINTDKTGFQILHDFQDAPGNGAYPYGGLIQVGATLYGMTNSGGIFGDGVAFSINTDGTAFTAIHEFAGGAADGAWPQSDLYYDGTMLYGMTSGGGAFGQGIIFRMNLDGSGFQNIYTFTGGLDGSDPYGSFVQNGNLLYGTTYAGGTAALGTIFSINTVTLAHTVLHNFTSGAFDGENPYGTMNFIDPYLYGSTYQGGVSNEGTIFRMNKDSTGFVVMKSLSSFADGRNPRGALVQDGTNLYGLANYGGTFNYGTAFVIDKDTAGFNVIHHFQSGENDGAYPFLSTPTILVTPPASSLGNLIYHNNFIDNIQQAQDDILGPPGNAWDSGLPDGGNYWSDYGGIDMPPDGIGDTGYSIPGIAGATDNWPWMREDGWRLPYSAFTSVAWDDLNGRFWLTCEASADAVSTLYYVPVGTPTTMVPIMAPPITFTAVGADNLGNILIAGDNLDQMFYYNPSEDNGWPVTEIGTDKMWGWNITSITFNSNDGRFYLVGNLMNQDKGVAFHTDTVPLDSGVAKCYKDTSAFMNSPEPGALKSIAWNPTRNYALVVGDGVYRVSQYDGNPGYELSWTEVSAPSAGITYSDVSWDTDGWNEAGISGDDNTFGSYWRYYHTNPILQDGFTNGTAGTSYSTCAMKPPSSPKWLLVLGASGGLQVNIQELDQSTDVSASTVYPNIYWVGFNDTGMTSLNNQNVNPDSWFNIVFEGNYSGGWNQVRADITFWFDDGLTGTNSQYPAETVTNRNRAFNLTYEPASATPYVINYPIAPALEITIGVVSDTISWNHPFDATQSFHRVVLQVHLGAQIFPADGNGFAPAGPDYHSDPNIALNNPNSWDFNVTLVDAGDESKTNSTYGEFGVKKAISIGISGSPNGEGTPGDNGVYLGSSVITYSTNADYWVNVSIPHLYLNGEVGHLRYIPAENMLVVNTNSLSNLPMASNMPLAGGGVYFPSENGEICVWGDSATGSLSAPANGTTAHGPWGSNYNYYDNPGGTTSVDWYVDLPAGLGSGTYRATISYSIETDG